MTSKDRLKVNAMYYNDFPAISSPRTTPRSIRCENDLENSGLLSVAQRQEE